MALINPIHGLVAPLLFIFTIPLAIFAGITTTIAFSILMFRVAVVYLDIALALIPQYVMGRSRARGSPTTYQRSGGREGVKSPPSPTSSVTSGSGYSSPTSVSAFPSGTAFLGLGYRSPSHRRKSSYGFGAAVRHSRRSSQTSMQSLGTITPIHEGQATPGLAESGLTPSAGIDRDFEGVGGWRLDDQNDDSDWANINSRLELPLQSIRHHQRSQSAGPSTPGEGSWLMMKTTQRNGLPEARDWERNAAKPLISPNSGRVRMSQNLSMPPALTTLDYETGYFPSPKTVRKSVSQHL
ncbi:hypothetical protein B0T19DRAFT_225168 [Cercophora scortea]|uniref:Uncharacterized protein n=1 Tax=Cercophora scortea TaxID=314031 RepID=A0AAE0IH46_9PEZI|nr:hypothetical protein B0T19DRAFT_225168 [Cercophora scortea]